MSLVGLIVGARVVEVVSNDVVMSLRRDVVIACSFVNNTVVGAYVVEESVECNGETFSVECNGETFSVECNGETLSVDLSTLFEAEV